MFRCLKKIKCLENCFNKNYHNKSNIIQQVYVLELENNKYYVGKSNDKKKRINRHIQGKGCTWTKKYKPINEIKPITKPQQSFWELWETLELMKIYGVDNVRGSMFTSPYPLLRDEKIMAAQLYCELYDLCRKCGEKGHFITQCKNDINAKWVNNFDGTLDFKKVNVKRFCLECNFNIDNFPNNYRYCTNCFFKN